MEKRSLKAGKTYIEAIQGNPSARKSLERVRAKLHLLAKTLESVDCLARTPVKMLQQILQDTSNLPELVADAEMDISALAFARNGRSTAATGISWIHRCPFFIFRQKASARNAQESQSQKLPGCAVGYSGVG